VVGRSRRADVGLHDLWVSSLHALVQWNGRSWDLKDLGSRNGTFLNGVRIDASATRSMQETDEVAFGDRRTAWILADASAPGPMAVSDDGDRNFGDEGILAIPSREHPVLTVFQSTRGSWRVESDECTRDVVDGETIEARGKRWRLSLPLLSEDTLTVTRGRRLLIPDVRMRVIPGPSEAETQIDIERDEDRFGLSAGAHGRILLVLARARQGDPEGGGWLERDDILAELNISSNHLNVCVHRARRQFAEAGFVDAVQVVERSGRRLRFGCARVLVSATSCSTVVGDRP